MLRRIVVTTGLMLMAAGSAEAQSSVAVSATVVEMIDVQPVVALEETASGVRILDSEAREDSQLLEETYVTRGVQAADATKVWMVSGTSSRMETRGAVQGRAGVTRIVPAQGLVVKLVGDGRTVTVTRVVAANS